MDNFKIDLIAESDQTLRRALEICIDHNAPGGKVKCHKVIADPKTKRPTLILFWHDDKETVPFICEIDIDAILPTISTWLKVADCGKQPDHDGDNGKGFRVFVEDWGHVFDHHYAICGIQPAWAMYGK